MKMIYWIIVLLICMNIHSSFAQNEKYIQVQELYQSAIDNPEQTVGNICSHRWVINAKISEKQTMNMSELQSILTFCGRGYDPVTGESFDIPLKKVTVERYGQSDYIFCHFNGYGRFYTSCYDYEYPVVISKDLKTWSTSRLIPKYALSIKPKKLGLTKAEAKTLSAKVTCTVTKSPLALICKEEADPRLKMAPFYTTYYSEDN